MCVFSVIFFFFSFFPFLKKIWQVAVSSGNRFEYGGDGGTPEIGLAALEHFYYTQDYSALATYMPLATLAATFYDKHYARDDNGTIVIWPTGVLEVGTKGREAAAREGT